MRKFTTNSTNLPLIDINAYNGLDPDDIYAYNQEYQESDFFNNTLYREHILDLYSDIFKQEFSELLSELGIKILSIDNYKYYETETPDTIDIKLSFVSETLDKLVCFLKDIENDKYINLFVYEEIKYLRNVTEIIENLKEDNIMGLSAAIMIYMYDKHNGVGSDDITDQLIGNICFDELFIY